MDEPGCSTSYDIFDLPEPTPPRSQSPEPELLRPERHERPKQCSICGKSAHGYHYDVPSCNGCKTFFRRLCISEKTFKCKANGDCFDLTKRDTPVKCRACRYQKCITVGMNPLAMELDEHEATASNFKRLVKREKPGDGDLDDEDVEKGAVAPRKLVIKAFDSMDNKMQKVVDMLTYLESKLDLFRKSAYNPHWADLQGVEFLVQSPNRISLADKYGPMANWPLTSDALFPPPPPPPMKPGHHRGPPPHTPDRKQWLVFNLMTTIEYAKTFMFFHQLSARDKLILTKHVTLACMNLLVSYSAVVRKFDTIVHPDGSEDPYRDKVHFSQTMMSVEPLIRYDIQAVEYILLKAIVLCNPAVPDLSRHAQTIIAKEREIYADALFDHCLRSRRDGPAHFAQLISYVDVLERQQRMQKDLHLLHIGPILKHFPKEHVIRVIEDIMDS